MRLSSVKLRKLALDMANVWSEWDEDGKLAEALEAQNSDVMQ